MNAQTAVQTKWGTWLQPHSDLQTPTTDTTPKVRQMLIALPEHWSAQRRRSTHQIEIFLLTDPHLRRLSVVPRECVFYMDHIEGHVSYQPPLTK